MVLKMKTRHWFKNGAKVKSGKQTDAKRDVIDKLKDALQTTMTEDSHPRHFTSLHN